MDKNKIFEYHSEFKGKTGTYIKTKVENKEDLSIAYTPGVAEVCREIHKDVENVYKYTAKSNTVAIVSDGTAVLGLGNIGPEAALPVMEGKALLFKKFANIDAVSICIPGNLSAEYISDFIKNISHTFGGINLEDVASPKCFEINKNLEGSKIAYFHDDQHGTAVVVLAALLNSLKLAEKKLSQIRIVINGAGAAGLAIAEILVEAGANNIVLCDIDGIINKDNYKYNKRKRFLKFNKENISGNLENAMKKADVFIGVSKGNIVKSEWVNSMNEKSIVFAMANPEPEIMPDQALKAGAYIVATGRSDFPNQVNNVLGFPGIFRGALDSKASCINLKMCVEAALALSEVLDNNEISKEKILPDPFDKRVVPQIAGRVAKSASEQGLSPFKGFALKTIMKKIMQSEN
ncbi:MAG: NADP-dependent malic enzyme [Candidatus Muirbacterium halophilum]|nr:NADP-dependent malic enzyme [Candidatus Muirbacterium halophilum]MCK9476027.1 NADP-dependent malic enzyme [Candidatus Muirbacterium halophilum]